MLTDENAHHGWSTSARASRKCSASVAVTSAHAAKMFSEATLMPWVSPKIILCDAELVDRVTRRGRRLFLMRAQIYSAWRSSAPVLRSVVRSSPALSTDEVPRARRAESRSPVTAAPRAGSAAGLSPDRCQLCAFSLNDIAFEACCVGRTRRRVRVVQGWPLERVGRHAPVWRRTWADRKLFDKLMQGENTK